MALFPPDCQPVPIIHANALAIRPLTFQALQPITRRNCEVVETHGHVEHLERPLDDVFFTVPTAPVRVLWVCVVLRHDRRRLVHLNVTAHPTAAWTAQQLGEAWPWDTGPRFVRRDREGGRE
jgi:hypothetical protein